MEFEFTGRHIDITPAVEDLVRKELGKLDRVLDSAPMRAHVTVSSEKHRKRTEIVVYWRDIPAQVIVKKGRHNAKRELPLRFTEAIDMCAMRTGAGGTDDYLAEWRKAAPIPVGDDLEAEAEKALQDIDAKYDRERLVALVKAGGKDV